MSPAMVEIIPHITATPDIGTYQFPDTHGKRRKDGDIDFGRALRIRFAAPIPPAILAYDWQDGTYRLLVP